MQNIIFHIGVPTGAFFYLLDVSVGLGIITAYRYHRSTPDNALIEEAHAFQFFSPHRSKGKIASQETHELQLHLQIMI